MKLYIKPDIDETVLGAFEKLETLKKGGITNKESGILGPFDELLPAGYYESVDEFSLGLHGFTFSNGDEVIASTNNMEEEDRRMCLFRWETTYRQIHHIDIKNKQGLLPNEVFNEILQEKKGKTR